MDAFVRPTARSTSVGDVRYDASASSAASLHAIDAVQRLTDFRRPWYWVSRQDCTRLDLLEGEAQSSMPVSDAVIELIGVTKSYGSGSRATVVLGDLDLRIPRGEFVSLMGPSGSGKTTILNLIAGLDKPDKGQVMLNGNDLGQLADRQISALRLRSVGFVFQAFNLLPALTVQENVAWPLEFSGYSRGEVRRRTTVALERAGVPNCAARHPAELSGGEQQRVAIARAIATGPSLVLADEPTGNLDSRTGQSILDLLRTLNESDGVTVVMVTHNVFAATYGHRTLELHDGRIIRDARAPEEPHLSVVDAGPRTAFDQEEP